MNWEIFPFSFTQQSKYIFIRLSILLKLKKINYFYLEKF